jgi:carbonic anhydrase
VKTGKPPRLVAVSSADDILPQYVDTPIGSLLCYHNLGQPLPAAYDRPVLLIGMCMDHRKMIMMPNEFAYVLRSAGANLRDSSFQISFAVAVGGVSAVALIGHTDCAMVHVTQKRESFVNGLVERAGWDVEKAARHFDDSAHHYEISDPIQFTVGEAQRLQRQYPRLLIAPLLYTVENDRIAQIDTLVR